MAKTERVLPEVLEIPFTITDETVNRYGWRLLVAGVDLTGFVKNPVCCVQHDTMMIPVGKWKNVRVENGQLKGIVEFDPNDELAVKLYWKYKDGYMNAVSLNVLPVEVSDEKNMLLPGQKYPTVVRCELLEVSLVTVPGQANAVKLTTPDGHEYKLNLLQGIVALGDKQSRIEEAKRLIQAYKNEGIAVSGEEIPYLLDLAKNNIGLVKDILETRKAN